MPVPLRVLILEDRPGDAELVLSELRRGGFDPHWERVETVAQYVAALRPDLDIVLADCVLTHFDVPRALLLLRERGLDVPVIVVTSNGGEEAAAESLTLGAADYLMKDQLGRLAQAVARALKQKRLRDEARRAEADRRESEDRFRRLAENAQEIIYRYRLSPIPGFEYISPGVTRITGYTPEQYYARPDLAFKILHPDQWKSWQTMSDNLQAPMKPVTCQGVRKDGSMVWLEQSGVPVFDSTGKLVAVEGLIRDVTEHKRAEEALRDSQQWLSAIVQASRDGIVVVDDKIIVYTNTAVAQMYGYGSPAELMNQHVSILHVPEDNGRMLEFSQERLASEAGPPLYEFKGRRKDGTVCDLEASVSVTTIAGKPLIIAVLRDVAQRKRLEEQFLQAQRMEALGRLAGGIAHDFNNILTAILGYTELLLDQSDEDDARRRDLEEIRKGGLTAASLTHQLLAFGRRQIIQPAVLDLNEVITSTEKMLRRLIGENIEVFMSLDPGLGQVRADRVQIEQVVMNLAVNARDAMPHGGKLTFETVNIDLDEAYARKDLSLVPGPYVMIAVSDTGCGMTPEVQARLFEPFFTTKELCKGTGLGLSTVYGIVKQNGGNIWTYSQPGNGSTFKIYLPRVDEALEPVEAGTPAPGLPVGTETILVVEDDDTLRPLTCRMLEQYGYSAKQARNADDAERVLRGYAGPLDLVLTDIIMPGISGVELGRRLALSHPGTKMLYTSGYANDAIGHHMVLERGIAFLPKPFTAAALARKVREVLDSQGP